MLVEKESVHPDPFAPTTEKNVINEPPFPPTAPTRHSVVPICGPGGPQLRIHVPQEGDVREKNARLFTLQPDHWERLKIDLPDGWNGQGLRLEPGSGFGLLEIAGVRIVSRVMGEPVWELLGRDLIAGIRATPATQLVSSSRRLRLLCTDGDTQIWLPDVRLPRNGEPLTLEIGLRVRTGLAQVTHVLHAWVEEADAQRLEATEKSVGLREDRDRQIAIALEYLTALEMARTDGSQRASALQEQMATAQAASRTHIATLMAEIDNARNDGNQRETALQEQMATAQAASRTHIATLMAEIDNARAHGNERVADVTRQLDEIRAHLEQSQAQLHDTEVEVRELRDAQARWLRDQALFQQEVAGLHQELHRAEHSLTASRQQHAAELAVERGANATNQGRVRSMQRSFSWQLTLPLRVLGRLLTGRSTAGR